MNRHQEAIDTLGKISEIAELRAANHMLEAREAMLGATSNVAIGSSPADIHRINQHTNQATDLAKLARVARDLAEEMAYGRGGTGDVRIVMFDKQGTTIDMAKAIENGTVNDDAIDFGKGVGFRFDPTQPPSPTLVKTMSASGLVHFAQMEGLAPPRYTTEQINALAPVIATIREVAERYGLAVSDPSLIGDTGRVRFTIAEPGGKTVTVNAPTGDAGISSEAIEASINAQFPEASGRARDKAADPMSAYMQGVVAVDTAPLSPVAAATPPPARSAPRNDDFGPGR